MSPGPFSGPARVLVRRVGAAPDPVALYRRLTGPGGRPHTLLLESAEPASRCSRRSLVVASAALLLRCRGDLVTCTALNPNGAALLPALAARLGRCAAPGPEGVALRFPPPPSGGTDRERLTAPSVFTPLRELAALLAPAAGTPPEAVFLAGLFAYELAGQFEALPPLPAGDTDPADYHLYLADQLVVVDHLRHQAEVIVSVFGTDEGGAGEPTAREAVADLAAAVTEVATDGAGPALPPGSAAAGSSGVVVDRDDAAFAATVASLQRHVEAGDVYQVVPSRTFTLPCPAPLAAYERLRGLEPSPYLFYLDGGDFVLFGASPESAVRVDAATRRVELSPIAGTRPRGLGPDGRVDPEADVREEVELRRDPKEVAEHLMLVDLARNDVARVARPGSRHVAELLRVERYSRVMHLVSRVGGELDDGLDALHAVQACMNMGTLTGAPKLRAMALLREHEPGRRGHYGGAVGYLLGDGGLDTAVVIRAALVREGIAEVRAGAGVVSDSVPLREAEETRRKAEGVLRAVAPAGAGPAVAARRRRPPPVAAPHVLLVDHHDSFTFNLLDAFAAAGAVTDVVRAAADPAGILALAAARRSCLLVLSPGPGRPEEAAGSMDLVRRAPPGLPLFGVCLGLQVLVAALGGEVAHAGAVVHGRTSRIRHDGHPLFAGLPEDLEVGRYHSLAARRLPGELEAIARDGGLVMAVAHRHRPAWGVQFHPESILTTHGPRLLANVLRLARAAACHEAA